MTEHKTEIESRPGGHTEFALMESQHPIEAEGEMHLARQAIIAANVGRNVEERLLVEGAIGIR